MYYTTKYNRAQLSVNHPQLNQVTSKQPLSEVKSGKKRFYTSKNVETSGHISSYGLPPVTSSPQLPPIDSPSPPKKRDSPPKVNREVQVDPIEEPAEESVEDNPQQPSEEVLKIRQEIMKKEEEIEEIKKFIKALYGPDPEVFNRIEKQKWDRQLEAEKKILNKTLLEEQITQKTKLRALETLEKQKETTERLNQLIQIRNEQSWQRQEALNRAQKYRQELNIQYGLQKQIHEIENKEYWESVPRPKENPPPSVILPKPDSLSNSPEKQTPPKLFFFTKKQPKNLVFNAITGELRDFAAYDPKSFSHLKIRNPSPPAGWVGRSLIQETGNHIVRRVSPT